MDKLFLILSLVPIFIITHLIDILVSDKPIKYNFWVDNLGYVLIMLCSNYIYTLVTFILG